MPESAPLTPVTMQLSTSAIAHVITPTIARSAQLRPVIGTQMNLSVLRKLTMVNQLENAPLVSAAPTGVDVAVAGADGSTYYVPRARIAERSTATHAPYVFLERREGSVYLQVWFDVAIPSADAQALPVDGYAVTLVSDGGRIPFDRCDELPPTDKPAGVVSQLFCETPLTSEQTNQVIGMMQTDVSSHFEVAGTVHYSLAAPPPRRGPRGGVEVAPVPVGTGTVRVRPGPGDPVVRDHRRLADLKLSTTAMLSSAALKFGIARPADATAATPTGYTPTMPLTAPDHTGTKAYFPTTDRNNRAIYAQVTTGFGTDPWAQWVPLQNGRFIESPVPEQFYVLPDEYRIAFDRETGAPAMMALLVPPERASDDETATSIGKDYKIRCRFSLVPWFDPARLERLRQEIVDHTGVHYPMLRGGGFRKGTYELSQMYQQLGPSLLGDNESQIEVDPLGFDLVLDCTSEFYRMLASLVVTDGVRGEVTIDLVSDTEHPETTTVPVTLRLDRPALDFLTAELIAPPETPPTADPTGDPTGEAPADVPPPEPLRMRLSNPIPYAVTIGSMATRLLVVDDTLPTPIDAVIATCNPATVTLPAGTPDAPSTVDVELTPAQSDLPPLYGGVGVGFIDVSVDIDPDAELAKAHEFGASADMSTTVEARSYQLEHPDVLPTTHADLFGIETQLKRGDAEPITIFLTRDQPATTVQVSFSLADVIAGARPEQPKFSWRRRNMAGSGTGEWSDWETIVGRQLFISPTGL